MQYKTAKGLYDILPYGSKESWKLTSTWHYLEKIAYEVSNIFGYEEIRTPIFEHAELFLRGVGPTSDIVNKEMYLFTDKAERQLALRPEGTSSILRAFIEHRLFETRKKHKFYYLGPMFRYERPQSGRYRQHYQFGVEAIGQKDPCQDAEVIELLNQFYHKLGLKNISLEVNSVGDLTSRENFKTAFTEFLRPHFDGLSKESKVRFEKNPLRILDSKDPHDQALLSGAPSILSYLSKEAEDHFSKLIAYLNELSLPYTINERIVRGLDYYSHTVFEFKAADLGAQNALGGGGRYDGFLPLLGGPNLPGIGFGAGIERILMTMEKQKVPIPFQSGPLVYFIPLGETAQKKLFQYLCQLRRLGIPADMDFQVKKVHSSLSHASAINARFALILGDRELEKKLITWKDLTTSEERQKPLEHLIDDLRNHWKNNNAI
jgi:histidyl-tRNA synthetase